MMSKLSFCFFSKKALHEANAVNKNEDKKKSNDPKNQSIMAAIIGHQPGFAKFQINPK